MVQARLYQMLICIWLAALSTTQAFAQVSKQEYRTPIQIVTSIIAPYKIGDRQNIPEVEQTLIDIGTPELTGLIRDHLECRKRDQGGCYLRFDPFVWGYGFRVHDLHFRVMPTGPNKQTVDTWFKNSGKPIKVHYQFIRQSGRWYLQDIEGPLDRFSEPSLVGHLEDNKNEHEMVPAFPDKRPKDPRSPSRIVSDLFKPYLWEFDTISANALRKVGSKSFLNVLDDNRSCQHRTGEDCNFSVSPITWSDDPIIKKLKVRTKQHSGDRQLVVATYLSQGGIEEIHYLFIRENDS